MLQTTTQQRKALTTAAFLALVWLIAAAIQPTSTYHLAPILVAGAVPVLAAGHMKIGLVNTISIGAGIAVAASLVLAGLDLLHGPTLLPYGGALAEALTFAAVGAVGGGLIAVLTSLTRRESAA